MKKFARGLSALLSAAMLFSCVAFAADSDKTTVTAKDSTSTTVAFTDADCTQLALTYTDTAIVKDGQYLLRVIEDDGNGNYVPTESTILDIRQVQAAENGSVSFTQIYPTKIANSAIIISGDGLAEPVVVAIIEVPYVLGDVDASGTVDIGDSTKLLQYLVGLIEFDSIQMLAADVDHSGEVDIGDSTRLLQYLVGLIEKF